MAITKAIKAIAKQLFANPKNYGNKRSLKSIKYIVIHYTANDGDTDEANAAQIKSGDTVRIVSC